jgi:hypothetical protein
MTRIAFLLIQLFTPKSPEAHADAIDWDSPLTRLIVPQS